MLYPESLLRRLILRPAQASNEPLTVNSHIASSNPQQAQQGFQNAINNGDLPQQLSTIGLNYVPGSANVSQQPFQPISSHACTYRHI